MNDLTMEQRSGRPSSATTDAELASFKAQLLTAIHENGRLADKLNRATSELAADHGFLANARARADQAERDRDEWRQAAEAAIAERDKLAARRSWLDETEQRGSAEREALMVELANELAEARAAAEKAELERDKWRQTAQAAIAERKLAEALAQNYLRLADQKVAQAGGRLPAAWVAPIVCIAFCAALWAVFAATQWWRP